MIGVILAGGQSARMGRNKALLTSHGLPLIQHVALAMQSEFEQTIICANAPDEYEFLGLRVVPDRAANSGPIGGIHSALHEAGGDSIFVTACDTPFISPELIRYLRSFPSTAPARIAVHQGRRHPLCGIYEHSCLPAVEAQLQNQRYQLLELLAQLSADEVLISPKLPFYSPHLLTNINTEADHKKVLRWQSF